MIIDLDQLPPREIDNLNSLKAILLLHQDGPISMTPLAISLKLSTAAITGIINRLHNQGYVERKYPQSDRRSITVHLTPKGTRLAQSLVVYPS